MEYQKENMFVYVDLSDFGKIHIAHSDMLSARLCLESIDQTMANILPSLKEGDLVSVSVKNTNQTLAQQLKNFF